MISDLEPTRLTRALIARGIALGRPLSVVATTTSTNDDAKRAGHEGLPNGAAFVADAQTAGRGRLGRTWHSPPAQNLYVSLLLRPTLAPKAAPLLTLAAGLAVRDAIAPLVPSCSVAIKWPNDVYVNGRKVAGILAEAQVTGAASFVVIGIGVNVRVREFPPEIAERATSLALSGGQTLDRGEVLVAICACLQMRIEQLESGALATIVSDCARHDALLGRTISIDGQRAVALGLADDGGLRIRRQDGSEGVVLAGDVQPER